ncbi:MAG: hypothetical protein IT165_19565 [Bryobacterales bacterium]|nr:hypothetical protein [Bryobacterales bacterium]
MYFDDAMVDAFIEEQLPEHRAAYRSFPYRIQKYDFFRYLAVYRYGGFYLDLDMFLARSLTPLLSCECVWPFEELSAIRYLWSQFTMDWQIGNYAFGSIQSHPFLAAVIDNCLRAQADATWVKPMLNAIPSPFRKQFYILNTTGPGLVSRTCAENPLLANRLTVLFPDDVRDPCTWHQFGPFGVHHMLGSWRDKQNFLSLRLTRLWEGWTLRRVLARGTPLGKTRRYGLAAH